MIIRKMAEKSKIKDLDTDAKEEVDGYIDKFIDIALEKVPKKHRDMVERAVRNEIGDRFIVRNTRFQGEVSPKTGKNYSLIHPSPHLGYETEAQADKRVKEMNKAGEISRARARQKTVREKEAEITEEVVEETMEEIVQSNSKLSDLMDELNITFGGQLGPTGGSFKDRGLKLDEKLDRIMAALEEDDVRTYTQEELVKLAQFISKLHENPDVVNFKNMEPYVRSGHKKRLKEYFQMAAKKVELEKMWKSVLKRRKAIDLIDDFLSKLSTDTFEKDR